jgi:hypothetical protein
MPNQLIHTNYGLRWMGRALANSETVAIHEVAVGIGNLTLDREVAALVDERFRMPPGLVYYEDADTLQVVIEVVLPVTITQVQPREVALFDSTGSCVACGTLTRATKFADDRMRIRMYLAVPSVGFVEEAGEASADPTKIEFPLGTLDEPELYPNSYALMHDKDPAVHEVVKIVSVTDTTVTLSAAPALSWQRGSRITPLRVARFDQLPQIQNLTDRISQITTRFEIVEYNLYSPAEDWGYCAPVFTFEPDWSDSVTVSHERNIVVLDNETGVRQYVDSGERDRIGTRASLKLLGRSDVLRFRKFVSAARGKTVSFWAPSFTMDIDPIGAISGSYFDAMDIGFSEAFVKPQDSRIMIAIVFNDGRPTIYRKLTSVVQTLTAERYFVDVPLPLIKRSEIDRMHFMVPSRFDQDGFEMRHHVDGSHAVSTSVVLKSVDIGDLSDINCFVTSKPYPVVCADGLGSGMSVSAIRMQEFTVPLAQMSAEMIVTGIELRNTLVTTSDEPHGLDAQLSVTGATLE